MASLAPRGRLHQLGAVLDPIQVGAFDLIAARRSNIGRRTSSPASMLTTCPLYPSDASDE